MAPIPFKRMMSTCSSPTTGPNPRPAKAPRTAERPARMTDSGSKPGPSSLRRTQSLLNMFPAPPTAHCLVFPSSGSASIAGSASPIPPAIPLRPRITRSATSKEQRERRKALVPPTAPLPPIPSARRTDSGIVIRIPAPRKASASALSSSPLPALARRSSPLCPQMTLRPPRPTFPRSKKCPDLRRQAINACMRATPEGRKALLVGPRLAERIRVATLELERIVAKHQEQERSQQRALTLKKSHVEIGEPAAVLSNSWVVVPPGEESWEMVDCSA